MNKTAAQVTHESAESPLMRAVDAIDKAIDSRLPQSKDALHRRKIAVRALGGAVAVAVTVAGYGAIPRQIESEEVTVQQGEAISDVLGRAQEQAAADNPRIDPTDTSYIDAAYALEHDQEVTGHQGYIKPGQKIEVDYARNWYGHDSVSAHVLPDSDK